MAFTPFMPLPPGPTAHTETSTTSLLLRYVAHVQETGLCGFPALEAHLQRHALELEARRAIEQAASRAALAEPPGAAQAEPTPEPGGLALQPPASIAERPTDPSPYAVATAARSTEAVHLDPTVLDGPVLDSMVVEPTALEPLPLASRPLAAMPRSPKRRASLANRWTKAARTARPLDPAPEIVDQPEKTKDKALQTHALSAAAATAPMASARNPELELLLHFHQAAQRGGHCDPPALQQRLTASVAARELERGNSREALERLKRRSHALLARIRAALPEDLALAPQSLTDAGNLLQRLSQLRTQLDDGLRCYGLRLDRPLQRMLERQLRRATNQERILQRKLRLGQAPENVVGDLMGLSDTLDTVLDQWLPLDPAIKASQNAAQRSHADGSWAAGEPWQHPAAANAIRPAVLAPLEREQD